jgi:hypothetical protein
MDIFILFSVYDHREIVFWLVLPVTFAMSVQSRRYVFNCGRSTASAESGMPPELEREKHLAGLAISPMIIYIYMPSDREYIKSFIAHR